MGQMEIGNLLFGNSRGPIEFDKNRKFHYLEEWATLLESLNADEYCHVYKDKVTPNENGGFELINNNGEKVFEVFPYYWGDCTCNAENKNIEIEAKLRNAIFTPEEQRILNEYILFDEDCKAGCPASFEFSENEKLSLKKLAKKCTCGARQRELKLSKEKEKLNLKIEMFNNEYDKNSIEHSKECLLTKHNFIYHEGKPDEFWIDWYKYPFRDSYCNREISKEEFKNILKDCISELNNYLN